MEITQESLVGYWLAGPQELDNAIYRPVSQFFEMKEDSTMQYLWYDNQDTVLRYSVAPDSVFMPFRKYSKHEFRLNRNRLRINQFFPSHYLKLEAKPLGMDSIGTTDFLIGNKWESEVDLLEIEEDSIIVYDHESKTKENFCWKLHDFEGIKFLIKQGSISNCEGVPRYLEYIVKLDENEFEVVRWNKDDFYKVKYRKSAESLPNYKEIAFRLCNPYIYRNLASDRYYFKYTRYDGELYELTKQYDKKYRAVKEGNNNGIVRVGFVVNCVGEIGDFDILELNNDYERVKLNSQISEQILRILQETGAWIAGERYGKKVDTFKFLSFKIKDGKIDEIFP